MMVHLISPFNYKPLYAQQENWVLVPIDYEKTFRSQPRCVGALLTSDKFWKNGSIRPLFGLIWRSEETSSEWAAGARQSEKRRRVAPEARILETR
ncbi:hypothetical protein [Shouchella shacheensis]|uniref:hypothetical protein n=1 Tax=Shouchella shacheensis TaxID=1649580 RepID=UPI0012F7332B|nr:hypothetical protein [Shouchella shacheensis]